MPSEKSRGHDRTRIWTAVIYPDSAPAEWREILDDQHFEWVESPLHEFDVNPTGEVKKAHWHLVLMFDGPKSYEQVCSLLEPLNCPIPQRCHSLRGAVRYLVHMDNPEKYQYSLADIRCHGGADIASALAPSSSERYDLVAEMMEFVAKQGITEFQDLADYARTQRREDWFPLICDNSAFVLQQYIKSQRFRSEQQTARR